MNLFEIICLIFNFMLKLLYYRNHRSYRSTIRLQFTDRSEGSLIFYFRLLYKVSCIIPHSAIPKIWDLKIPRKLKSPITFDASNPVVAVHTHFTFAQPPPHTIDADDVSHAQSHKVQAATTPPASHVAALLAGVRGTVCMRFSSRVHSHHICTPLIRSVITHIWYIIVHMHVLFAGPTRESRRRQRSHHQHHRHRPAQHLMHAALGVFVLSWRSALNTTTIYTSSSARFGW